MKPKDLRPLLDEVLPEAGAKGGPSCADVLGLVREERAKRGQRRVVGAAAVVLAGLFAFSFWPGQPKTSPAAEGVAVVPLRPVAEPAFLPPMQRINDDELLALLKDTPSALMDWPNGERTLLIVEHR